jgi:hypothetical protein
MFSRQGGGSGAGGGGRQQVQKAMTIQEFQEQEARWGSSRLGAATERPATAARAAHTPAPWRQQAAGNSPAPAPPQELHAGA